MIRKQTTLRRLFGWITLIAVILGLLQRPIRAVDLYWDETHSAALFNPIIAVLWLYGVDFVQSPMMVTPPNEKLSNFLLCLVGIIIAFFLVTIQIGFIICGFNTWLLWMRNERVSIAVASKKFYRLFFEGW